MTKEEFLKLAESRYDEIESLKKHDNFYDYEKEFVKLWQEYARDCMEHQLNDMSKTIDRRKKKKTLTRFGDVSVIKMHPYMSNCKNGFGISPYMMELMTYAGHLECYGKSNEILHRFMDIDVSPAQIYRVTDLVSELLEEKLDAEERILPPLERDDMLYVEVDGSMVHIREEGWKEAKVGRLFKGSDCLNPNSNSSYLTNSHYVAHLGNHTDFCELTEQAISSYGRYRTGIVFITDGATWIKNWIEEAYPDAYAILDYFHVCEYLYAFADSCFGKDVRAKDDWCDTQKKLLLESKVEIVLDNIRNTSAKEKDKEKLLNYYQKNISRMDYKRFKSIGCGIIGSGAIESAHRTVIQKRMKLSGQHWTRNGAVNMLRLRVVSMNKQWHKVIDLLKQPMQYDRAAA